MPRSLAAPGSATPPLQAATPCNTLVPSPIQHRPAMGARFCSRLTCCNAVSPPVVATSSTPGVAAAPSSPKSRTMTLHQATGDVASSCRQALRCNTGTVARVLHRSTGEPATSAPLRLRRGR
ncbi:hypothetical protein VPH35_089429 [Triticum aestivum]